MTTPKPATVLELFEGHPERWTQCGNMYATMEDKPIPLEEVLANPDKPCKCCLFGAYYLVYGELFTQTNSFKIWQKVKAHFNTTSSQVVFDWNDAPDRTFEEVLELVRKLGI